MAEPCVQLAQRLAANEKRSRDRALRRLRNYLRERSGQPEGGFSAEELSKIWKGLFYCLWMQDKPLLQEELSLNMAKLVHSLLTRESRNTFIRVFWQTLNREWNGIDRLRLDKFYSLMRFVLHQSVLLVSQAGWEESMVEEFLSILMEEVMKTEAPRGVQHHLLDIYLEELAKVGSAELTAEMTLKLIDPFCKMAAKSKEPILQQSVLNGIFQTILDQAPFAIEDLMKELGQSPADTEGGAAEPPLDLEPEDVGPVLQFDYQAISERLFSLASQQNIPTRNRKSLYRLVKRFKDLAEGVFPQDDFPEEVSTDEDDDEYSSWRFRKRQQKFQERLMASQGLSAEPEKKGKRRRGAPETEDPSQPSGKAPPAKKKRRKKRTPKASEKAAPPMVNGKAESPPAEKKISDVGRAHKAKSGHPPAEVSHDPEPPPNTDPPPNTVSVKRKKRSSLLRLGLSLMPLRGAAMLKRKRLIARRKMIGNKAVTPDVAPPPRSEVVSPQQDFITFQKLAAPRPLYVKSSKTSGRQIGIKLSRQSKKVTFSLKKNTTAEFRRTDRSLQVSPAGSSRIPFHPDQRPRHGVLKSPSTSPAPRARASDFF